MGRSTLISITAVQSSGEIVLQVRMNEKYIGRSRRIEGRGRRNRRGVNRGEALTFFKSIINSLSALVLFQIEIKPTQDICPYLKTAIIIKYCT